ncbi:MAG: TrkH family potassium uptake protein [Muribaculaceae bacterium]|nr:TrkH family potassium uptake protein [Roseburia sp.]MCM1431713.1 TrkH family potassium uptake protein [Muribaculaceae bacterium]MCM1491615.1 TrkH family potassium uptake protein [Muribaculaceae bacterium]
MKGIFERHRRLRLNQVQYIAAGFFLIILAGACVLSLPISARDGSWTGFLDAMFTATSATCVTGLVVFDTYTHWSLFGQLVILLLIQIGGLGFISISVGFAMIFRRRIGLRQRDLIKESVNALDIGGMVKLVRRIFLGTLCFEGAGAVLLAIRFIPRMGFAKGVYYGIFHSVSAFCNAGFDLMGYEAEYSSFTGYAGDPVVNLTLMALIIIGGLGFVVWDELAVKGLCWRRYTLHTKLVLSVTAGLVVSGALLLYLFERGNTIEGMGAGTQALVSLFGSVTARTAGFNTVDTGALRPESKFLTILLMFIGGSPGSTAGGVKTTTIAVMLLYVASYLRGGGCNVFRRRISDEVVKKASMVFCLNLFLGIVSVLAILGTSGLGMEDILFEVYSAISTVGMTTGITRELNTTGRVVIALLMYCGRVGSLTFALSFVQKPDAAKLTLPVERITIG